VTVRAMARGKTKKPKLPVALRASTLRPKMARQRLKARRRWRLVREEVSSAVEFSARSAEAARLFKCCVPRKSRRKERIREMYLNPEPSAESAMTQHHRSSRPAKDSAVDEAALAAAAKVCACACVSGCGSAV
jgi:hypothetical protein